MQQSSLFFTSERSVEVRQNTLPGLQRNEILVETRFSAISPGTEMLIYRGEAPQYMQADSEIHALRGGLTYPLKYGYAAVGEVVKLGKGVDKHWLGCAVFAFNPHESHFIANTNSVQIIPQEVELQAAVFLPNVETSVNFVMDGDPRMAEQVVVLGQGIVGLLTTALLAHHPLANLLTFDRHEIRRNASLELGAHESFAPQSTGDLELAKKNLAKDPIYPHADLIYELSGNPHALDLALELAGFDSRVIIGSWYGEKRAHMDLGGRFHRNRIKLISSQVSTLNPILQGRWNKERRFNASWEMLSRIKPTRFITHQFPIEEAAQAYQLLDNNPQDVIQVIFDYA